MIERLPASVGLRITGAKLIGDFLVFRSSNAALRLSPIGASACGKALAHAVVATSQEEATLFDRIAAHGSLSLELLDANRDLGLATAVIPIYNNPSGLERLLGSLAELEGLGKVIVVDDCSDDADQLVAIAARFGANLHRQAANLGPAAARNAGAKLAGANTQVLVFIDADLHLGCANAAATAIAACQAGLGFAAPRVRSGHAGMNGRVAQLIARYEASHSPLDMGPNPALMDGTGQIWYVPSAFLAIRAELFDALGGFCENFRYGEDVDLVTRAIASGAIGYYSGESGPTHDPRAKLFDFVAQRFHYGASATPLARVHPDRVVHFNGDEISIAALVMPGVSMLVRSALLLKQHRALRARLPEGVTVALNTSSAQAVLRSLQNELQMIGRAVFAPLGLASIFSSRLRSRTARLLALRAGIAFLDAMASEARPVTISSAIEATPSAIMAVIDDLAYSTGLAFGALTGRSLTAYRARLRPGTAFAALTTRSSKFRFKAPSEGA